LSRQSFSCADVGVNIVTLTVTDINGNAETCTSSVTIADDDNPCCTPPQAFCQDVTVQLNASGNGSLSANEVDDGSTADCGLQSLGIDITVFDCSDVDSPSAVTLTVTDVNGNASTCTATVKVEDNLPPVLVCQDVTIQLNSDGFKVFNTATLMDSQSDNCGGVLLSTGNLILNCANVGSFQATLTAEDSHENSTSCTQTVTVEDKVAPVAQCQDITVQLDEEGNAAIGPDDVDNGSSDACGVQSTVLSGQSFSCADVGSNTVTLTVTDVNNNTSTCTATVTVEDNIAPLLNCSDRTVSIENLHGVESVPVYQLYQGGADNCDGAFFPPFEFVEFGCGDVGTTQNLVFSYTDASGNTGACTSVVTIVDNTRPAVSCKNINVSLDENGQAQIAANQVIFSAFDACGIQSRSVSQTDFDCDDIGPNVVQVTVTDNHGNSRSCNATVTVKDAIAPTAVCRDATVQLDPAGQAILTGDDLDNGSFDECGGIQSTVPSQQSFSCGDVGANTVTLTVTDVNNNASTCTATVTVEDYVAPDAVCRNVTVQLDENGAGSTTAAAVDNGSGDACGIQSAVLSRQSFSCADAGANTVTLTVTDVNNNTSTCSATVTVEDNISPIALCNNITVLLDMDGQGEITAAQVDNGSSDACGIQTLALNQTKFDCEQVGTVVVTLVATDVNGNASTCSATVTVEDQVNPIALCRDATVQLDANGAGSTTAAAVDNGSSDACGVQSAVPSQQSFSCGDVGANTVTLIVTDVNNNASTCTATVTVEDNVAPDAVCRNVTVQLDENGAGSTTAAAVDNGSGDACGIQSAVLSRQSFSCADMGANTVTLTVTDVNNNASTCSATVTVEDNLDPEVVCSDITVTFNGEGSIGLDPVGMATASDNCAVTGFEAGLPSIACDALGEVVPVTVTAQDAGGNTASCTSHVTVEGLPCGWMSMPDGIGCTNGNEGSFDPDAETFTLLSSGCYTPSATSDESGYIKYQLCGNGTITAHIAGLTLPGYAGIVMRESDAPGAKKVAMAYQGGSAIARYVRYTDNGGAFPSYINAFGARWLRIVRTGNIFRGYYSVNGVTWTYAFAVTVPMDNCIQVGLIAWGTNANSAVTATFDHVVIDPPYGGGMQKGAPGNSVQPVSIAQETAAELWPNPTSGIAMLKLAGSGENEIEVLDDLGRQVICKRVDAAAESVTELDLSGQAPGMYFVRVKGTDGEAALLRLVVADR
ncbi:MAG: T9SS type A sorting domain-containing protein, partial [Lewinella sp.]|nr:T9SS type A sorting domain-containing protein [Lewinella sp.]